MTYDFRAWLNTKPNDEKYEFMDCTGKCAMGQYMKDVLDESWSINRYNDHVRSIFKGDPTPLSKSTTFGELKAKVLELA